MVRKITAFYAWQSDSPEQLNRRFIRIALEEAAKRITENPIIDAEVTIDYDTEGVPGTPPVTQTILNKIVACDIFIPDVSFVARTDAGKLIPNPNVMAEYGYALCAKSHTAMMPIMNEAFGSAQELPFDMGHLRFPLQYRIEVGATDGQRRAAREALSRQLEERLRLQIAATEPPPPESTPFPAAVMKDGPARFRAAGEALGIRDAAGFVDAGAGTNITLAPGPAMWLRLMPEVAPEKNRTSQELGKALNRGINLPTLMGPGNGTYTLRAQDGVGTCILLEKEEQTKSVAFAFKTGEIWAIDTWLLASDQGVLYAFEIEKMLAEQLARYGYFLRLLGLEAPYRWIAGLTGVKSRQLQYPTAPYTMRPPGWPGPRCASEPVTSEGLYAREQSSMSALLPFFNEIYDSCGIERPAHLPQS